MLTTVQNLTGFVVKSIMIMISHFVIFEVERLLSKETYTASGCDHIPAWLLRSCSYELADIVTHILNCSISTSKGPSYWLNAVVTPVPKVHKLITFLIIAPYQSLLISVELLKRS